MPVASIESPRVVAVGRVVRLVAQAEDHHQVDRRHHGHEPEDGEGTDEHAPTLGASRRDSLAMSEIGTSTVLPGRHRAQAARAS